MAKIDDLLSHMKVLLRKLPKLSSESSFVDLH